MWEKTCQTDVVNFFKFLFLEKSKTLIAIFEQSGISGPGKCKIWNLGIKISKISKFELIEMKGFKVLIFPMLTSKCIETY